VLGSRDHDRVDVLVLEEASVVGVASRPPARVRDDLDRPFEMGLEDVAEGPTSASAF
jgi:hypothetical protein